MIAKNKTGERDNIDVREAVGYAGDSKKSKASRFEGAIANADRLQQKRAFIETVNTLGREQAPMSVYAEGLMADLLGKPAGLYDSKGSHTVFEGTISAIDVDHVAGKTRYEVTSEDGRVESTTISDENSSVVTSILDAGDMQTLVGYVDGGEVNDFESIFVIGNPQG